MSRSKLLAAALGLAWTFAAAVAMAAAGTPRVVAVSPSGRAVPENLLRISIRFDAAPEGQVLRRLSLATRDGRPLHEPFLDQELWSPDGRVLTVLLHPGRVKTGLIAHEQLGAILAEGETVQLMLDGQPLWRWVVGPRDEQGPRPDGWRLSPVRAGHRDPLVVRLDGPIDARGAGYVAVVDARHRRVAGRPELLEGERVWRFTPAKAWSAGPYQLVARGTLEDPAGNRLNSRFERDADQRPEPAGDVAIPFEVTRTKAARTPLDLDRAQRARAVSRMVPAGQHPPDSGVLGRGGRETRQHGAPPERGARVNLDRLCVNTDPSLARGASLRAVDEGCERSSLERRAALERPDPLDHVQPGVLHHLVRDRAIGDVEAGDAAEALRVAR